MAEKSADFPLGPKNQQTSLKDWKVSRRHLRTENRQTSLLGRKISRLHLRAEKSADFI